MIKLICFCENLRQYDDLVFSNLDFDLDIKPRTRIKNGAIFYLYTFFQSVVFRRNIAIVYPRQRILRFVFENFSRCFFLEDGLNFLKVEKTKRDLLAKRWIGYRMNYILDGTVSRGYRAKLAYLSDCEVGIDLRSNMKSIRKIEDDSLLVILNNFSVKKSFELVRKALDLGSYSAFNKIYICPHPDANEQAIRKGFSDVFHNGECFETLELRSVFLSVKKFSLILYFNSAASLDLYLAHNGSEEQVAEKMIGIIRYDRKY